MCFFITVGINKAIAAQALESLPSTMKAISNENPSFAHLQNDLDWYYITTDMCSCELYRPASADRSNVVASKRRKYERKGWSKGKIERALKASSQASHRKKGKQIGLDQDLGYWIASTHVYQSEVYFYIHWYEVDLDEVLELGEASWISITELAVDTKPIAEDILYCTITS